MVRVVRCGVCGLWRNGDVYAFCPYCAIDKRSTGSENKENSENELFCPCCGTKNPAGGRFCVECGYELPLQESVPQSPGMKPMKASENVHYSVDSYDAYANASFSYDSSKPLAEKKFLEKRQNRARTMYLSESEEELLAWQMLVRRRARRKLA